MEEPTLSNEKDTTQREGETSSESDDKAFVVDQELDDSDGDQECNRDLILKVFVSKSGSKDLARKIPDETGNYINLTFLGFDAQNSGTKTTRFSYPRSRSRNHENLGHQAAIKRRGLSKLSILCLFFIVAIPLIHKRSIPDLAKGGGCVQILNRGPKMKIEIKARNRYLFIEGLATFNKATTELFFEADNPVLHEQRV
ncbi:hypothetical protein L1887_18865 [Cichorium endivia]|nr:hypothetical protein L1887_18865 [Cichorium endivia]